MAINPPSYQKDAIPTRSGWAHPRTGELLVGGSIPQKDIDAYLGVEPEAPAEIEVPVQEWTYVEVDLSSMSKRELETLGREYGVELDRRKSKTDLIEQLEVIMENEYTEDDAF